MKWIRGVVQADDSSYVLGEQEAIWLLRLVLPYVNELLLKLRALFSGDPATTMKVISLSSSCIFVQDVHEATKAFVFFLNIKRDDNY